jgi:magnesium-transporting ATPase (P-type)
MATLTEVFPCFSLNCKENARAKPAKTGHGPHSFRFVVLFVIRIVLLLIVLFYVFFVCKCVLYHCHRASTQLQFNKYIDIKIIALKDAFQGNCLGRRSWQYLPPEPQQICTRLHGVAFQKTVIVIVTTARTSSHISLPQQYLSHPLFLYPFLTFVSFPLCSVKSVN